MSSNGFTEAALDYANNHDLAVFPCVPNEKRPATPHGCKDATKDPEEIRRQVSEKNNLAIATGQVSSIVVVDIDMPDGKKTLGLLEAANSKLPPTVEAKTPRGGRHLYFRVPLGTLISNSAGKIGENIDIRGDGGYVVAPPSSIDGKQYEWNKGCSPDECDIVDMPEWLLEKLVTSEIPSQHLTKESLPAEFEEGTRNDSLMRIACGMRAAGKNEAQIATELQEVNLERCVGPLPESEVIAIAKSVSRYPQGDPFADFVPFPCELLPEPLGSYIQKAANNIACDDCFLALPFITSFASVIGASCALRLSSTWLAPTPIWTAFVGKSGTGKSPAIKLATKWLKERESQELKTHFLEMDEYKSALAEYDRKSKHQDYDSDAPIEPVPNRLCLGDTTIEALCLLLSKQPHGLALIVDELSGWYESITKRNNSKAGDAPQWLEMFDGGSLTIDRKTGDNRIIHVPYAAVGITGGIQPEILMSYASDTLLNNGLFARFLFAHPPSKIATWDGRPEVTLKEQAAIDRLFERIYSLRQPYNEGSISPTELSLTSEAKKVWAEFYDQMQIETEALEGALNAAWSKLIGYAPRLAMVIHMIRWASGTDKKPGDVDAESMRAGIRLTRWFGNEAKRIYKPCRPRSKDEKLLDFIKKTGGTVSARDVQRGVGYATAKEAEEALASLSEKGIGSWQMGPKNDQGGPPPRTYVVEDHEYGTCL